MPNLPPSSLLRADEEQLARVARLLRDDSAFILIVCPPSLRAIALNHLRRSSPGMSLAEAVEVRTAEEAMDALVQQSQERASILSLTLAAVPEAALEGLNWHREKLLAGAPVILWVEDEIAVRKMREVAPDAFSFRSAMVLLRGATTSRLIPPIDPKEITHHQRQAQRARNPLERARAEARLSETLRMARRYQEAEQAAHRGWRVLEMSEISDPVADLVKADVARNLASIMIEEKKDGLALRWSDTALALINRLPFSQGLPLRAYQLSVTPGYMGKERISCEESLDIVRRFGLAPEISSQVLRICSSIYDTMGNVTLSSSLLREAMKTSDLLIGFNRALLLLQASEHARFVGDLDQSLRCAFEAEQATKDQSGIVSTTMTLAFVWLERGELGQAERLLEERVEVETQEGSYVGRFFLNLCRNKLSVFTGDMVERLDIAKQNGRDREITAIWSYLVVGLTAIQEAEAEQASGIIFSFLNRLDDDERWMLGCNGEQGPPWHPILFSMWRGHLLALQEGPRTEAIKPAQEAMSLARARYADLLPETGRELADHLLKLGRATEALEVIKEAASEAQKRGFLREHARLLGLRTWAYKLLSRPETDMAEVVLAWQQATDAIASPRIKAELLSELALRIPPETTPPDPLQLAQQAHELFVAMPMPAHDARCMEIMGDVLAARGQLLEALDRYRAAYSRLERYELALRLPLLRRKMSDLEARLAHPS